MDVLSEVLRAVRLEGALFFNGEFSAPWCLSTQPHSIAPYLSAQSGQLIIYHFVTGGHAYAQLRDGRREELLAGDVVVFPHGDHHFLGNGVTEPVDSLKTFGRLPRMFKVRVVADASDQWLEHSIQFSVAESNGPPGSPAALSAGSELIRAKLAELLFVETLRRS